jgi:signal transduction histidine kinase
MTSTTTNSRLLFRTSAFQLALVYAAIFLLSVFFLFGILYWTTIGSVSRQIDATIETEILGLAEQYERRGLNGLVDVLTERVNRSSDGGSIYLFADSSLRPIAGNLRRWPSVTLVADGQIEFDTSDGDGQTIRYRANILSVGPNYRLLVGRDVRELVQLNTVFKRAGIWGVAVVLVLAFTGGVFMSFSAQRKLAGINRTARRIIDGDLSQRVPITGARDEYDDLAININEMLAQIEALLGNVRHVGDSVAHDLKTPLTRLRNRLESLAGSGVPISAELEKCVAESDSLLATFNALLRIARIESGAYRTAFSTTELTGIVEGACDLYQAAAEQKDISLNFSSTAACPIYGDSELLAQAVTNLLDNSVKYTPAGGTIDIAIREKANNLELSVTDSGLGVPEEDHRRIQQRFIRLDAARSKPGNGLGLSLVQAVADQHRGRLEMENLQPGFKVTIVLPRNSADSWSHLESPAD